MTTNRFFLWPAKPPSVSMADAWRVASQRLIGRLVALVRVWERQPLPVRKRQLLLGLAGLLLAAFVSVCCTASGLFFTYSHSNHHGQPANKPATYAGQDHRTGAPIRL